MIAMTSSTAWYPVSYYIQPAYSTFPTIRVQDCYAGFFKPRRQRFWRRSREAALAMWAAGGITFDVTESDEPYLCDRITLVPGDVPDPIAGWAAFEYPPCDEGCEGCAWTQLDLEMVRSLIAGRNFGYLRYLIGHEVGHNLGFGHGGTGIMAGEWGSRVNEEELAALRAYWFK